MNPELVKFHLPTTDQFSVAVDTRVDPRQAASKINPRSASIPHAGAQTTQTRIESEGLPTLDNSLTCQEFRVAFPRDPDLGISAVEKFPKPRVAGSHPAGGAAGLPGHQRALLVSALIKP
jgi:hypothetical protein